ncbi:MAG: type II toxin-antitoxin system Phd/YefM family antitoxin [Chthoniobacterales bacterium]|nr:type II toxin-antitoxin system Phd/YefM family antitoxin [Chthoniobacterales bacterium]
MQTMLVSEFKAKAIATLKHVRQTGEPVLVTLRGKPLAEVFPVRSKDGGAGVRFGSGRGLMKHRPSDAALVRGDFASEWEMNG